MASIILRKLCSRSRSTVRSYYKLSCAATRSATVLNLSRKCTKTGYSSRAQLLPSAHIFCQHYSDSKKLNKKNGPPKLSLFQKFRQMYRDYWYVLVPVHVVTSIGWFGSFYYLAKSGIDIAGLLQSLHVSDVIINPLRDSTMGYMAVSYALYKIFTPVRYMVTLGGTTVSINYLKKWGYIKPVPSAQELKSMYTEKRDNIIESVKGRTGDFKFKTEQLKEKKDEFIEDIKLKYEDSKEHINEKKKDLLEEMSKPLKIKTKD